MRIRIAIAGLFFALVVAAGTPVRAGLPSACTDLTKHGFAEIPDAPTSIISATVIQATENLPTYCRVRGTVSPHIGFEVRLPVDRWNGKFFMQGCHGFCGEIEIEEADDALARGYSTAATDMGHSGAINDLVWAYNNREAEIDFGVRATHVVALAAKAIAEAFHGKMPQLSYFRGCATGGHQALMEAERFPADFDGIIAGAPTNLKASILRSYWTANVNLDDSRRGVLTPQLVYLLRGAVMAKCDAIDGLKDGILEDPRACNFNPAELACKRFSVSNFVSRTDCLTPAQIEVAKKIYDGPATSDGASLIAGGGQVPGGELTWLGTIVAADGGPGSNLKMAEDSLRYLAFAEDPGPTYKIEHFDLDRDAERLNFMQQLVGAPNPDLRRFRNRGGRLLLYQGWQDGGALGTVDFYDTATDTLGGEEDTLPFFRLFMVPGMNQCGGGPGVNTFDLINVIQDWVEFGKAPDSIFGIHKDENGVAGFSRPVYAYPNFARFDGNRDHPAPENFKRQVPKP